MGGTAVAANLPCGAWREHTRKFSPQWFLAVHATIPFVAMLRKAVLMPKWAILLTLAGASECGWVGGVGGWAGSAEIPGSEPCSCIVCCTRGQGEGQRGSVGIAASESGSWPHFSSCFLLTFAGS